MRLFDTKVQELKYKVLKSVAKHAFNDHLSDCYYDIPYEISPHGTVASLRCCVYKERAIAGERVRMALGGDPHNSNVIQVIKIACDECPVSGMTVSDFCRGCVANHCKQTCPKDAISIVGHRAQIDNTKCIQCAKCAVACPYDAIHVSRRPCEKACKVKAIGMDALYRADIDNAKCIQCGACVYQCPFGAITDKSYITQAIELLRESNHNKKYKVYAAVAPSISSQFGYAKLGQVISGLKALGFHSVVEVALGADMVAYKEAKELVEKGFLTSSCCPAFVSYVEKFIPEMKKHVSHNYSPMVELAEFIKKDHPDDKVIFIGPCTAKKQEFTRPELAGKVDCVLTFEELQAMIDGACIDLRALEEEALDNASYYGRIFARSGGLSDAVRQAVKELGIPSEEFSLNPVACDGIEQCKVALLKASKGVLKENFIEGMACVNGCIGGAGCLTHGPKDKTEVDQYGKLAMEKTITDAIAALTHTEQA